MKTFLISTRSRFARAAQHVLVWLFSKLLERRGKFYTDIIILGDVLCFIEVWRKITGDKPVDQEAPLYRQINDAIDFYLWISSRSRSNVSFLEREILPLNYAKWALRDEYKGREKTFRDFLREHQIIGIVKKYINLCNYISFRATEELGPFETATGAEPSSKYWESRFSIDQLPQALRPRRWPRTIRSHLRREIYKSKREIASNNYLKIDITASDVTALVTLSSATLLLLGYCRVAILNWWFGVPYQRYYAISDYIASSVNSISQYLIGATAAAVLWALYLATINAYSLQAASVEARKLSGRINNWALHFVGILCLAALAYTVATQKKIDPLLLEGGLAYLGFPIIGYLSANFFSTPYRAFLFISLVFAALVAGLGGVVSEIQKIAAPTVDSPSRILDFTDGQYSESQWAVLDFTSSFVILRRRSDGLIQVRSKSNLKDINDVPKARTAEDN